MNPKKSVKSREKFRTIHYIFYIEYERLEFLLNFPVNLLNMEIIDKEESKRRQSLAVMELDELEKRLSQGYRVYKKIRTTLNLKDDWDFIKLKILFMRQYSQLFIEAFDPAAGYFYLQKAFELVEKRKKMNRNPYEDDVHFYDYLVEIDRTHFFISTNDYDSLLKQCDQYIECASKIEMYKKKPINMLVPFRIYVGCGMIYEFFNQNTNIIVNAFLRGVQIIEKNIDDVGRYFLQNDLLIYVQAYVKIVKCKMRLKDFENAEQWARSTLQFISQNSYLLRVQPDSQIVKKIQLLHQAALHALMAKNLIIETPSPHVKVSEQQNPPPTPMHVNTPQGFNMQKGVSRSSLKVLSAQQHDDSMQTQTITQGAPSLSMLASIRQRSSIATLNQLELRQQTSSKGAADSTQQNEQGHDNQKGEADIISPRSDGLFDDPSDQHSPDLHGFNEFNKGDLDGNMNKRPSTLIPLLQLEQQQQDETTTHSLFQPAQTNHLQVFLRKLEEQLLAQNNAMGSQNHFKPISQLKSEIVAENLDTLELGRNVSKQILEEKFFNLPKAYPSNFQMEQPEIIEPDNNNNINSHRQININQSPRVESNQDNPEEVSQAISQNESVLLKKEEMEEQQRHRPSVEGSWQEEQEEQQGEGAIARKVSSQQENDADPLDVISSQRLLRADTSSLIEQSQNPKSESVNQLPPALDDAENNANQDENDTQFSAHTAYYIQHQQTLKQFKRMSSINYIERIPEFNEEDDTPQAAISTRASQKPYSHSRPPKTPVSLSDLSHESPKISPRISPKPTVIIRLSPRSDRTSNDEIDSEDNTVTNPVSNRQNSNRRLSVEHLSLQPILLSPSQQLRRMSKENVVNLLELQKVQSSQSASPTKRNHLVIQRIPEDAEDADDSPKRNIKKQQQDGAVAGDTVNLTDPTTALNIEKKMSKSRTSFNSLRDSLDVPGTSEALDCQSPMVKRAERTLSTESNGTKMNEVFLKNQLTPNGQYTQQQLYSAVQLSEDTLNTHASFHSNFNHFASEFPGSTAAVWMNSHMPHSPAQKPRKSIFADAKINFNNNNNSNTQNASGFSDVILTQLRGESSKQDGTTGTNTQQQKKEEIPSKITNRKIENDEKFANYFTKKLLNNTKRGIHGLSLNKFFKDQVIKSNSISLPQLPVIVPFNVHGFEIKSLDTPKKPTKIPEQQQKEEEDDTQPKKVDIKPFDGGKGDENHANNNNTSISSSTSSMNSSLSNSVSKPTSVVIQKVELPKRMIEKSPNQLNRKTIGMTDLERDALKVMIRKKFERDTVSQMQQSQQQQQQFELEQQKQPQQQLLHESSVKQKESKVRVASAGGSVVVVNQQKKSEPAGFTGTSPNHSPNLFAPFRLILSQRQSLDFLASRAMTSHDFDDSSSTSTIKSSSKNSEEKDAGSKHSYLQSLTNRGEISNRTYNAKFAKQTLGSSRQLSNRRTESLTTLATTGQSRSTLNTFHTFY